MNIRLISLILIVGAMAVAVSLPRTEPEPIEPPVEPVEVEDRSLPQWEIRCNQDMECDVVSKLSDVI